MALIPEFEVDSDKVPLGLLRRYLVANGWRLQPPGRGKPSRYHNQLQRARSWKDA
jgi:hypothetical protein